MAKWSAQAKRSLRIRRLMEGAVMNDIGRRSGRNQIVRKNHRISYIRHLELLYTAIAEFLVVEKEIEIEKEATHAH